MHHNHYRSLIRNTTGKDDHNQPQTARLRNQRL
jgi:hypothetical protein